MHPTPALAETSGRPKAGRSGITTQPTRHPPPTRWVAGWLIVLLWTLPATVRAQVSLADLQTLESRAYRIHTNLTREEAQEYGQHMDLIYRAYSKRFASLRGSDRDKQNLYLLRTREDYISTMRDFGIDASATGGVFFWGGRGTGLATWIEGLSRDQVFDTLQHEGFHQFAHTKLGTELPLWVNEGLAEYFGAAIVVDDKVRLGIVDEQRVETVREALRTRQAIDFDQLLNISPQQWHQNMNGGTRQGRLQYDQSWAIVHFLIHGDGGRYQKAFSSYLTLISQGRDHEQAFRESFGTTNTGPFARRWEKFIAEVEVDHYSTALRRIRFLGAGLEYLMAEGSEMPQDVNQLAEALKARQFRLTRVTESGSATIAAADDSLYAYDDRDGQTHPFTMAAPAEKADGQPDGPLPPQIEADQLRPAMTLVWTRDDAGRLRSVVEYR